jgi:hypothetical protein
MVNYEFAAEWLGKRTLCALEIDQIATGLKWLHCLISKKSIPILLRVSHPAGSLDVIYLPSEHKRTNQINQNLQLQANADKLADLVIHVAITALLHEFLATKTEVLNIQFMNDEELLICLPSVSKQIADGLGLTLI